MIFLRIVLLTLLGCACYSFMSYVRTLKSFRSLGMQGTRYQDQLFGWNWVSHRESLLIRAGIIVILTVIYLARFLPIRWWDVLALVVLGGIASWFIDPP